MKELQFYQRLLYFALFVLVFIGLFSLFRTLKISGSFVVLPEEMKKPLYFDDLPDVFTLSVQQPFFLDVDYEEGYIFSDNAVFFDINEKTGIISFVPSTSGYYPIMLLVFRDVSDYKIKLVHFVVEQ